MFHKKISFILLDLCHFVFSPFCFCYVPTPVQFWVESPYSQRPNHSRWFCHWDGPRTWVCLWSFRSSFGQQAKISRCHLWQCWWVRLMIIFKRYDFSPESDTETRQLSLIGNLDSTACLWKLIYDFPEFFSIQQLK